MILGSQTVKLRSLGFDESQRGRLNQPEPVMSEVLWSGVLMRPASVKEKVDLTEIATSLWFCTGPPVAAVLAMKADGELVYDGTADPAVVDDNTYQIIGVEPFKDRNGRDHHVRITCQRQVS